MFELLLTETFARELKKLDRQTREMVKKKLEKTQSEPLLFFERLSGSALFKLRVGKYRIIAQISSIKKQIILLSIGHRKNVYNKLELHPGRSNDRELRLANKGVKSEMSEIRAGKTKTKSIGKLKEKYGL